MAAAEKISFIESPWVQLALAEKVSAVASTATEVPAPAISKRLITAQAPRLAAAQKPQNFESALIEYMTAVLTFSMALASQQTKIAQGQTGMSQEYVAGAETSATASMNALLKAQHDAEEAAKKSFWQKILGYVGVGLIAVLGLATANPELCIMAGLMVTDQATGATDKLTQALTKDLSNLSPALQKFVTILTKVAVALAMAIVVGGLVGGIRAALTEGVEKSFADKAIESGFANGKGLLGCGQFFATFTQMMVIVNPFTDIMQTIVNQMPMSDAAKKVLGQILGMVTALVLAYIAGKYTGVDGAPSIAQNVAKSMTQTFRAVAQGSVGILLAGTQIASGVFGIQQGLLMKDQSEATRLYGGEQALLTLFTEDAGQVSQMIKQSQVSATGVNNTIAAMNSRWDDYIAPYQLSAEITG